MRDRIQAWDRRVILACHRLRNRPLTLLMQAVTWSGAAPAWVVVVAVLGAMRLTDNGTPATNGFLAAMLAALVAWAVGSVARLVIRRPRPYVTIEEHGPLVWVPKSPSMPSTHAATSVGLFVALLVAGHAAAPAVGIWALLTVVSRLYLGVHYATDLIAGSLLGIAAALVPLPIS